MFMFWCVAPIEYNGSHLIYDKVDLKKLYRMSTMKKILQKINLFQIISPIFKVSQSMMGDVVQTRILDEITETLQVK